MRSPFSNSKSTIKRVHNFITKSKQIYIKNTLVTI